MKMANVEASVASPTQFDFQMRHFIRKTGTKIVWSTGFKLAISTRSACRLGKSALFISICGNPQTKATDHAIWPRIILHAAAAAATYTKITAAVRISGPLCTQKASDFEYLLLMQPFEIENKSIWLHQYSTIWMEIMENRRAKKMLGKNCSQLKRYAWHAAAKVGAKTINARHNGHLHLQIVDDFVHGCISHISPFIARRQAARSARLNDAVQRASRHAFIHKYSYWHFVREQWDYAVARLHYKYYSLFLHFEQFKC